MTPSQAPDPTSAPAQQDSIPPEYMPNRKVIVPIVLISSASPTTSVILLSRVA